MIIKSWMNPALVVPGTIDTLRVCVSPQVTPFQVDFTPMRFKSCMMYQMGIKVVFDFELGSFATNPATRSTTVPFSVTFIGPLPGFTFARFGARLSGAVMVQVCPFHVLLTPICVSSWLTYQIGIYVVPPDTNESG